MKQRLAFATGTIALCVSGPARAGQFDQDGVFSFDPAAVRTESFTSSSQMTVKIIAASDALEGDTFARIDTPQDSAGFTLDYPQKNASYRARMFARTNRVIADIDVGYPDDGGSPSFYARFYPTGVVTSDGWYEVATNAFSIEATRAPKVWLSINANNADVDAFELVPQGTFRKAPACSAPRDPACAPNEICAAGYCRNGDAYVPPAPPIAFRAAVAEYFKGRMQIFFGGRFTRENTLPIALATLDHAKTRDTPWEFWNDVTRAIRQLHDWHTTMGGPVWIGGKGAFPICLVEGDADLSHAQAPKDPKYWDVLVSHTGSIATSGLKPGDRIVAINGAHPIAWAESLDDIDWQIWRANDPETHAEAAERLPGLIRRWAKTITVVRCDPKTNTCGAPQDIDWTALPPDANGIDYPYCDNRPQYHLGSKGPDASSHNSWSNIFYGPLVESMNGENLWGSVWNDVYLDNPKNNPYAPMIEAFRTNAAGVIMDHRLGNGGTVQAAEYLTSLFRAPASIAVWPGFNVTVGMYDDFTTQNGLVLFNMFQSGSAAYNVGSANAKTKNMPTALLLARDGSASDWFPFGMQNVPNVRLFGRRTAGAFSSFFQFDYFGQFDWRMASGDLIRPDGTTHLGEGVIPDEEIVPKQSDLLAGKDTVFLRALAWIRTCAGCR